MRPGAGLSGVHFFCQITVQDQLLQIWKGVPCQYAKGQRGECSLAQDIFSTLGLPDCITEKLSYRIALRAVSAMFCKVISVF